jgi:hypothetical protein
MLAGCNGQSQLNWWNKKSAPAGPPTQIRLDKDETWGRTTPHRDIRVQGAGSVDSPWLYTVPVTLDLQGHTVGIHSEQGLGSWGEPACAILRVQGGLVGRGSVNIAGQGRHGAGLQIEAAQGIELARFTSGGVRDGKGGYLRLVAGGPVVIAGCIQSTGPAGAGDISIRGQSISIGATNGYSIFASGPSTRGGRGGNVELVSTGPVQLAGGIAANGNTGQSGLVSISGGQGQRCGPVSIGGHVFLSGGYGPRGGLAVVADALTVQGSLLGQGAFCPGANVDIDCLADIRIRGTVLVDSESMAPGHVRIRGWHIWLEGQDKAGWSILTTAASARGSQTGDGDVILTGIDSRGSYYDPAVPLAGPTSSVFVAGAIVTGYAGRNVRGQVDISAVEVQLGGDIQTQGAAERTIEIHYGTDRYGVRTHLVEKRARWDGRSEHAVTYSAAAPVFYSDVPYAGARRR